MTMGKPSAMPTCPVPSSAWRGALGAPEDPSQAEPIHRSRPSAGPKHFLPGLRKCQTGPATLLPSPALAVPRWPGPHQPRAAVPRRAWPSSFWPSGLSCFSTGGVVGTLRPDLGASTASTGSILDASGPPNLPLSSRLSFPLCRLVWARVEKQNERGGEDWEPHNWTATGSSGEGRKNRDRGDPENPEEKAGK